MPTNNYSLQTRLEVSAARQKIIDAQAAALGTQQSELVSLLLAKEAFTDSQLTLGEAKARQIIATEVNRLAITANLAAANLASAADKGTTEAIATAAAMNTASTNIVGAVSQLDALVNAVSGMAGIINAHRTTQESGRQSIKDISGAAGVANPPGQDDPINTSAREAQEAVTKANRELERLKTLALRACVAAARAQAPTVSQSARSVKDSVGTVAAGAAKSLLTAEESVQRAADQRMETQTTQYQDQDKFDAAAKNSRALHEAVSKIDKIANGALSLSVRKRSVMPGAHFSVKRQSAATEEIVLEAKYEIEPEEMAAFCALHFILVPEEDVPTFTLDTGLKLKPGAFKEGLPLAQQPASEPKSKTKEEKNPLRGASLESDYKNEIVKAGVPYCVFVLKVRQDKDLVQASDLSLPSLPVTPTIVIGFGEEPPMVFVLPFGAFLLAFEDAQPVAPIQQYRVILMNAVLYDTYAKDSLFLVNSVSAANYVGIPQKKNGSVSSCAVTIGKDSISSLFHSVSRLLKSEAGKSAPTPHFNSTKTSEDIRKKLAGMEGKIVYFVYFSPSATERGYQKDYKLTVGNCLDGIGNPVDIDSAKYRAVILATGVIQEEGDEKPRRAANAVSTASDPFSSEDVQFDDIASTVNAKTKQGGGEDSKKESGKK